MRHWIFFLTVVMAQASLADTFTANFRSEIGPLPKTPQQKLTKAPDFKFNAKNWDEAIHTGQSWLGSERQTSQGSRVIITGVELREAQGRNRACVLGDMVVSGVQACPKPAWKGSPLLNTRIQTGRR